MNRLTRRPWRRDDRRVIFPLTDCRSESPRAERHIIHLFPDVPRLNKPSFTSVVAKQIKKWGPSWERTTRLGDVWRMEG